MFLLRTKSECNYLCLKYQVHLDFTLQAMTENYESVGNDYTLLALEFPNSLQLFMDLFHGSESAQKDYSFYFNPIYVGLWLLILSTAP